jgi:putative transposase
VGEDDVLAKVVYTVTNPAKDHLVKLAKEWPGATSLGATISGGSVTARRPTRFFRPDGSMPDSVEFQCVLPPTHQSLSQEQFGEILRVQIAAVEDAAAAERRRTGRRVLGWKAVLAQRPTDRPRSQEPRRQLNPRIAARDKWPLVEAIRRLKAFRSDYANRRAAWLEGADVVFPSGTWWLRKFAMVKCTDPAAPS